MQAMLHNIAYAYAYACTRSDITASRRKDGRDSEILAKQIVPALYATVLLSRKLPAAVVVVDKKNVTTTLAL